MCRHCDRLVEDNKHKEVVHAFMVAAAEVLNRRIREDGYALVSPITADDIDIQFGVAANVWSRNPFADSKVVAGFVHKDLLASVT